MPSTSRRLPSSSSPPSFYFAYAERAEGEIGTHLRWAVMSLDPVPFGAFSAARIHSPVPPGPGVRPGVALDIEAAGSVFMAGAYDPGSDDGPFSSQLTAIGQFRAGGAGSAELAPSVPQAVIARQDGFKIEGLTVREVNGLTEVYAGTDDENYGAVLRRILPSR